MAGSKPIEAPVYARLPVSIERGDGCWVWDAEGRAYLDLYGGHAVAGLGYNHPALTSAIAEQARTLTFQTNAVQNSVRERAITQLVETAPMANAQAFMVNSGAEANENALRLAFTVTGRSRVTAVRGSFHGRSAACAAVTDHSQTWYGFPRAPFEVDWVDVDDVARLDEAIGADTAALIFEPVQGVAGAIDLSPVFVQRAVELCRERGALVIADEVQCGAGRSGTLWTVEQLGVQPDLLTAAKSLGGGFPLGAVLMSGSIGDQLKIGQLGTTFGGGPMACAAMSAVLSALTEPSFLPGVRARSQLLRDECHTAGISKITGRGFMLGLHLGVPAAPIRTALLERGFLTGDAKKPDVIRLLPPLILNESEIRQFGAALTEVLA